MPPKTRTAETDPWSDGTRALERAMRRSEAGEELAALAADPAVALVAGVLARFHRSMDGEDLTFVVVAFSLVNPFGEHWPVVGVFERETWTAGAFHTEREARDFVNDLS
jgi:hypothetical protein